VGIFNWESLFDLFAAFERGFADRQEVGAIERLIQAVF